MRVKSAESCPSKKPAEHGPTTAPPLRADAGELFPHAGHSDLVENRIQRTAVQFPAFDIIEMPTYSPCYLRRVRSLYDRTPCKEYGPVIGVAHTC